MTDMAHYTAGYVAALRDVNGRETSRRWSIVTAQGDYAAVRSLLDPGWVDKELDIFHGNEPPLPRRAPKIGTVYVAYGNGRFKIGYTGAVVADRMKQLSNASGLDVGCVCSFPGTRALETELHERFAKYRIRGEWFEDCTAIREWVLGLAEA